MPSPYSNDLRQRVLAAYQEGLGIAALSQRFKVSKRTISYWIERFKETGRMAAKEWRRGPTCKLDGREEELRKLLRQGDFTLDELHEKLGKTVSRMTIWRTLQRMGYGIKKNTSRRRTRSP